jgi:hypothetical protein
VQSLLAADGVVFAGREDGPILRSQDAGRTWEPLRSGPTWVTRLRRIGRAVYAIGGDIWSTRDGGDTWQLTYARSRTHRAWDIDIQGGALVVGTHAGALRQVTPRGDWTPSRTVGNFGELARVWDVLYAGPVRGMYRPVRAVLRSVDGGGLWAAAGAGSVGMHIVALEAHGSTLYAGLMADALALNGGVRFSRDGGETWAWSREADAPQEANRLRVVGDNLFAYSTSKFGPDRRIFRAAVGPPAFEPQLTVVRPGPGALLRIDGSDELRVRIHNHAGGWRWRLWADGDQQERAVWAAGPPDGVAGLSNLTAGVPHTFEVELIGNDGERLSPRVARRLSVVAAQGAGLLARDVRIAFVSERDRNSEVYTVRPDGSGLANLTNRRSEDSEPAWSPDGTRIAFVSDRSGSPGLHVMDADGANVERLTTHERNIRDTSWSPSGSHIAYLIAPRSQPARSVLVVLGFDEDTRLELGPASGFAWSPDGSRMAVTYRDYSGPYIDGVAVTEPDGGNRIVISEMSNYSSMGGTRHTAPVWTPDGTRVLFSVKQVSAMGRLNSVTGIIASPDGLRQATGGWASLGLIHRRSDVSWAPDSSAIAREDGEDVYVVTPDGLSWTRLTWLGGSDPAWQPLPDGGLVTGVTDPGGADGATRLSAGVSVIRLESALQELSAGGWDAPTQGGQLTGASLIALGATLCLPYPPDSGAGLVGRQGSVLHGSDFALTSPGEYIVNFPQPIILTDHGGSLSAPSRGTGVASAGQAAEPWAFAVLPTVVVGAYLPLQARLTVVSAVAGVEASTTLNDNFGPMLLVDAKQEGVAHTGSVLRLAIETAEGYPLGADAEYTVTQQDVNRAFAVVEFAARPTGTRLLANYPSPFNPETWLPFELTEASDAVLTIYGAGGDLVRTLRLGRRAAGFHVTRRDAGYWDGRNEAGEPVSSGVYYYELGAGDVRRMRRMVISR